jgi:nucleotide-binding universal stress UspA family protein
MWELDSTQILIALLIAIWLAGGAAVALAMGRSGHDFSLWLALAVLLGPFAGFFARERHTLDTRREVPRTQELRTGTFDALAGIDGSEESIAAVRTALSLFGDRLTSLTLATALDYEASGSFTGIGPQSQAYSRLVDVASMVEFDPIEMVLLYGSPGETIARLAQGAGFELIILGARGHGMSEAFFGSVTEKLIGSAPVPVFVGPRVSAEISVPSTKDSARASA